MKFFLGLLAIILLVLSVLFLTGTGPFLREGFTTDSIASQNRQLFIYSASLLVIILILMPVLIRVFKP